MVVLPSHPETAMEAMVDATAATVAAMEATGMDMTVMGMAMAAVAMGMVMGEVAVGSEELACPFWVVWLVVFCSEICCLVGSEQ